MRVLFIIDEVFGHREGPLIERLGVGLADEGVRVVRAVPETSVATAGGGLFMETTTYSLRGLSLTRRARAERLLERVRGDDRPIDLVHAMGGTGWRFAAEVASLAGVPLALEAWRSGLPRQVQRVRAALTEDAVVRIFCPDARGMDEYQSGGLGDIAVPTPWGIHVGEAPHDILDPARATAIVIIASGRDPRAIGAALEGLTRAVPPSSDARLFMDAEAARTGRLYPLIERLGLSERLSLIPDMEARRDLTLMSDLVLLPEALGERRTITLDAMGRGLAVIARADPRVETLIDGVTARLLAPGSPTHPTPEQWGEAIATLLARPEDARRLGASAREHVAQHCRASGHVAAVLSAYQAMTGAGTGNFAFPR